MYVSVIVCVSVFVCERRQTAGRLPMPVRACPETDNSSRFGTSVANCSSACMCMHVYVCGCMRLRRCVGKNVHCKVYACFCYMKCICVRTLVSYMHARSHVRLCVHAHTYTFSHSHTLTLTHTHVHKHTCMRTHLYPRDDAGLLVASGALGSCPTFGIACGHALAHSWLLSRPHAAPAGPGQLLP